MSMATSWLLNLFAKVYLITRKLWRKSLYLYMSPSLANPRINA